MNFFLYVLAPSLPRTVSKQQGVKLAGLTPPAHLNDASFVTPLTAPTIAVELQQRAEALRRSATTAQAGAGVPVCV